MKNNTWKKLKIAYVEVLDHFLCYGCLFDIILRHRMIEPQVRLNKCIFLLFVVHHNVVLIKIVDYPADAVFAVRIPASAKMLFD